MSAGIMNKSFVFFSTNIFLIAGSKSQATPAVASAEMIINKKIIKIWDRYLRTCVLQLKER